MRKKTMASGWAALAARNCAMTGVVPSLDGTASAVGGWTRGAFMGTRQGEGLRGRAQAEWRGLAQARSGCDKPGRRLRERGVTPRLCPQL
ncbi:hypothetical protein GCM10007859_21720 [Brevundimonas denitrificans]|uniref:Uncharacterized protein n=1 Tax=Brevundimonas denitrificans TaxID=1443434 RepID=A0ABQ6BJQ0_9CAUL|nr:hypothetical protein GCM10007859_21720 [Brevundimonas denitrificans]